MSYLNGNSYGSANVDSDLLIGESPQAGLLKSVPSESIFKAPENLSDKALKSEPKIRSFLEKDFTKMGQIDGLNHSSEEALAIAKNIIQSSFTHLIDAEISKVEERVLDLENLKCDLNDAEQMVFHKLQNTVDYHQKIIGKLKDQKALAENFEGWISGPVHRYISGFRVGINDRALMMQVHKPYTIL